MSFGATSTDENPKVPSNAGPPKVWTRLWFWMLIIACGIGANRLALWVASESGDETQTPPALAKAVHILPECLNFGTVFESDSFEWNLVFENVSDNEVFLDGATSSCSCVSFSTSRLVLRPGQEIKIPIRIDLSQIRRHIADDVRFVEVPIGATIAAEDGSETIQLRWVLRGNIRRHLSISSRLIAFRDSIVVNCESKPVEVTIFPNSSRAELSIKQLPPTWKADLRLVDEVRQQYRLRLTSTKTELGPFSNELVLGVGTTDDRKQQTNVIRLEGVVVPPCELLPRTLNLGVTRIRSPVITEVIVRHRSNELFEIVEVTPGGTQVKCINCANTPIGWIVSLELDPNSKGTGSSEVKIVTKTRSGKEISLVLPVSWYGVES